MNDDLLVAGVNKQSAITTVAGENVAYNDLNTLKTWNPLLYSESTL